MPPMFALQPRWRLNTEGNHSKGRGRAEQSSENVSSMGKHNWTCGKCDDLSTDFEPLQSQFDLSLVWSKFENEYNFFLSVIVGVKKFVLVFANFKVKLNLYLFCLWFQVQKIVFTLCCVEFISVLRLVYFLDGVNVWNVKTWQQFLQFPRSPKGLEGRNWKQNKKENKAKFYRV